MRGRMSIPPDCNGPVVGGLAITIAGVCMVSLSCPIHRPLEPRWVSARLNYIIGSSQAAVTMHRLTQIEFAFMVLMAASAADLMLALGFSDQRRGFALLTAIGAKPGGVRRLRRAGRGCSPCRGVRRSVSPRDR